MQGGSQWNRGSPLNNASDLESYKRRGLEPTRDMDDALEL